MKFFIQFLICGMLTSLIFPPFFLTPIGFVVFTYLFYLFNHSKYISLNYRFHFISGFLFGFGFFSIYLIWIKEPFLLDEFTKNYSIVAYLLIFYCSVFFGIIFLIIKYFNNRAIKLFVFPSLIVIAEFLCGNFSYGFPWFSFALVHSGNFIGTSLIYYLGTYGLSYITILIFLFPSVFFFFKINRKIIMIYLVLLLSLFLLIFLRINQKSLSYNNEINIALVQLNLVPSQILNDQGKKNIYNKILKIIQKNNSDIIIFGENNYPYLYDINSDITILKETLKPKQKLIIGATRKENENYYNSLLLIDKNSYQKFDKKILVPFGEFIPLRFIFNFMELIAGSVDFSIGKDNRILKLNNLNILPVICYEIIYFWTLLETKNINTNIIINLTNDVWFGKFSGPYQHFYFTRLRASEFNKHIIRVSNNGVSAIIDNYGSIIDYIGLNKYEIKNVKISIPQVKNNYIKFHKIIFYIIVFNFFLGFLINRKNVQL